MSLLCFDYAAPSFLDSTRDRARLGLAADARVVRHVLSPTRGGGRSGAAVTEKD